MNSKEAKKKKEWNEMIKQVGFSILHSIFDHSIFNSGVCSFFTRCVCCLYRRFCFAPNPCQRAEHGDSLYHVTVGKGIRYEHENRKKRKGRRGRTGREEEEEEEEEEGRKKVEGRRRRRRRKEERRKTTQANRARIFT